MANWSQSITKLHDRQPTRLKGKARSSSRRLEDFESELEKEEPVPRFLKAGDAKSPDGSSSAKRRRKGRVTRLIASLEGHLWIETVRGLWKNIPFVRKTSPKWSKV